jgi:CRISPR/Cas system-associated protein Cas10 (large subunit of type III CRISPR-Cas system)
MFDKKLAEAVRSEIVRIVAEHQAEIQRKAVMSVDNPLLANEILKDRLNEASAYFAEHFSQL